MEKDKIINNLITDLKRGTVVLVVLLNTDKAIYGYSLVQSLQEKKIDIDKNTLYPLLRRLESQGLLNSEWNTEEARPRKYYVISSFGKEVIDIIKKEWIETNLILNEMMEVQ